MKPSEKRIGVVPVLGIAAAGPPPVYYAEPVCLPTCYWTRGRPVWDGYREFGSDHTFKYATERVARLVPRSSDLQPALAGYFFVGFNFSAYDLAQNAMREKQAMRKIMKTTFSIARMYRSDKFAAR
jgi:hypothetical protein